MRYGNKRYILFTKQLSILQRYILVICVQLESLRRCNYGQYEYAQLVIFKICHLGKFTKEEGNNISR